MKTLFNIEFWEIPHGGHMFAGPELFESKLVESTLEDIDKFITSKTDGYKVSFRKLTKKEQKEYKRLGYDFDYKASNHCFYSVKPAKVEVI